MKILKKKVGQIFERWPYMWKMVMVFRYRNHPFLRRLVSPGHHILIEGYPRCANSFSVKSFVYSNGWRDVKIATHTHSPAQVKLAVRWSIPSIVLFRDPDEAIISLLALNHQSGSLNLEIMSSKRKLAWIRYMTKRYIHYYNEILRQKDKILLVSFMAATDDFAAVIRNVNNKFNTEFDEIQHAEKAKDKIFELAKPHLYPNVERNNIKDSLRSLYFSEKNKKNRDQANKIYRECIKSCQL